MFTVHIRQEATGIVRNRHEENLWEDADGDSVCGYMWTEGNYSCDCNRASMWADLAGEDDPEPGCGDEKYKIRVTNELGEEVYTEWDAPK